MKSESARPCAADVFENLEEARKQRRNRPPQEVCPAPCGVEKLEDRRLLSYTFSGGVLTFTGTSSADTIIGYRIVNGQGDNVYVRRNAATPEIAGPFASSGAGSVTKVVVNGAAGNDTVYFELGNTDVPFNYGNTVWNEVVEVHGNNVDTFSDGQDSISGGPLADTLWGDGDNDKLFGYGGADIMYGGYGGADTLEGGNGNDLMYGGDGGYGGIDEVEPDVLYGQGDNDTLYGEAGSDWLDPGPGADFAYGGLGNDTFRNSLDNTGDLLDGGGGTDDAGDYDGTGMDTLLNFP